MALQLLIQSWVIDGLKTFEVAKYFLERIDIMAKFYCPEFENISFDIRPSVVNVINGKRSIEHGKSVKFDGHLLETDDNEAVDYLRAHEWFGTKILEGNYIRRIDIIDGQQVEQFILEAEKPKKRKKQAAEEEPESDEGYESESEV